MKHSGHVLGWPVPLCREMVASYISRRAQLCKLVDPEKIVITQNTIVPQVRDVHSSLCYDLRCHS